MVSDSAIMIRGYILFLEAKQVHFLNDRVHFCANGSTTVRPFVQYGFIPFKLRCSPLCGALPTLQFFFDIHTDTRVLLNIQLVFCTPSGIWCPYKCQILTRPR